MGKQIAIDGPAGAGKSTIAKMVAKKLGFIYVDTGAMYRGLAVFFVDSNIDYNDEKKLGDILGEIQVDISYIEGEQHVFVNKKDVTSRLRLEQTGEMASKISAKKQVRQALLDLQRKLAKENDVVMDGRDIGTVILPDATLKVFLTASVRVRAKRRYTELFIKNEKPDIIEIEEDIKERDARDMTRKESPLKKADDASVVDSSNLSIDEVVDLILKLYSEKVEA